MHLAPEIPPPVELMVAEGVSGWEYVATVVVTKGGTEMRSVGVREFRDQATSMMGSGETLVIERHGVPIGFFVPVSANDRGVGREALGRLGELVEDLLEQTGVDEEVLVREVVGFRRKR